jgi:hypothetical protein
MKTKLLATIFFLAVIFGNSAFANENEVTLPYVAGYCVANPAVCLDSCFDARFRAAGICIAKGLGEECDNANDYADVVCYVGHIKSVANNLRHRLVD